MSRERTGFSFLKAEQGAVLQLWARLPCELASVFATDVIALLKKIHGHEFYVYAALVAHNMADSRRRRRRAASTANNAARGKAFCIRVVDTTKPARAAQEEGVWTAFYSAKDLVRHASRTRKIEIDNFVDKTCPPPETLPPDSPCVVCLETLSQDDVNVARLPCGHCFHRNCISEALAADKSCRCPLCRHKGVDIHEHVISALFKCRDLPLHIAQIDTTGILSN